MLFERIMNRISVRYKTILLHIILWSILIAPSYLFVDTTGIDNYLQLMNSEHLFTVSLFYINYFLLVPFLLNRKRYVIYLLSLFFTSVLAFCVMYSFRMCIEDGLCLDYSSYLRNYSQNLNTILLYSVVSIFARSYVDWQKGMEREFKLKNEKIGAELAYLKNQIDPHFFFNNLNNLYSLCLNKDENAAVMVSRLSDMMRAYMNNSKLSEIALDEEIEFIKNFIRFQLLKRPKSSDIDLYTEGNLKEYKIAPLLLINFVENAFKHSNIFHDKNARILINCLLDNQNNLEFQVENTIYSHPNESVAGIGNKNTKRQLDLIYKDRYSLIEEKGESNYKLVLNILNNTRNE